MLGSAAVCCLPGSQQEGERTTVSIGDGVDFGVATAPAAADRLEVRPPFPPAAERCALTCVLSISTSVGGPPSAASASKTARQTPLAAGGAKPQEAVLFFTPQAHTIRIRVIHKRQVSRSR